MTINHAQLVFNNDTFTRRHIFSFLPNECPHQVKRKNTLVKEFNKLNVYICQLYNNETQFYDLEPEYNNYNNHFRPSQYTEKYINELEYEDVIREFRPNF